MTATVSPAATAPVLTAAPYPAMTPQPISDAASRRAAGSIGTHCPACTRQSSANAPMPRAAVNAVPSSSVMRCFAFWLAKQYQGRPRRQLRHVPHGDRHAITTTSPADTLVTPSPTACDAAGRLMPEQEGEVVTDPSLAVVEVRVADPASFDADQRFVGAGVGDVDRERLRRAGRDRGRRRPELCGPWLRTLSGSGWTTRELWTRPIYAGQMTQLRIVEAMFSSSKARCSRSRVARSRSALTRSSRASRVEDFVELLDASLDVIEQGRDGPVIGLEPIDHGTEIRVRAAERWEHVAVLAVVVHVHEAAVVEAVHLQRPDRAVRAHLRDPVRDLVQAMPRQRPRTRAPGTW